MKNTLFIIFIILFSNCTSYKSLKSFDGTNGAPKKIEKTEYEVFHRDNSKIVYEQYKNIYFYDYKLRRIKELTYMPYGKLNSENWSYYYNEYGNKIKSVLYNGDSVIFQNIYKYNKNNILIEYKRIEHEKKSELIKIIDDNKRTEIRVVKNKNGSIKDSSITKYDKTWSKIETISYDSIGKFKIRLKYLYDKNGNWSEYKKFNNKNELLYSSKTIFNKFNDPISANSITIKNNDTIIGKVTKFEYKYDKRKNIKEEKLYSDNKLVWITKYKYEY